jgi:hypothetical protein
MPLAGKMLYNYTLCSCYLQMDCGDTGLQTGIPDSVQNFHIPAGRHHEENWWNTEMQF